MFTEAVSDTNEGQKAIADLQKKYQPQKDKLDAETTEVETLKKELQAAPATLSASDKAAKEKVIETKDTAYQHEVEDVSNAYQADVNEALGKVAEKFAVVMRKYVSDNGYTLLINVGDQQSPVMWAAAEPNSDITLAVIDEYNKTSGVAAAGSGSTISRQPSEAGSHNDAAHHHTREACGYYNYTEAGNQVARQRGSARREATIASLLYCCSSAAGEACTCWDCGFPCG